MCGISGMHGLEGISDPHAVVERMTSALVHRGPDAGNVMLKGNMVLGHRRLSIIDLNPESNQPFEIDEGQYSIVYNGELYNYIELREELGEDNFKTQSDTEVILMAYKKWGRACLQRFNGMFAFAIWDAQQEKLLLARDRMGIKPLYFSNQDHHLLFSSEVRSLLASGMIERKLNPTGLVDYLRYQTVHQPNTLVQDVYMLPSGHYLEVKDNEQHLAAYWEAEKQYNHLATDKSGAEVKEDINRLLSDSVRIRMRADVPYGAFLSGGIDSSIVVGLMAKESSHPVKTFTVTFDEEEFSEAKFAAQVATKFGTDHTDIRLHANEFLKLLPNALEAIDHPSGDGPNTWIVSKVTRESGITMALSGLGGDELFGGYPVFKQYSSMMERKWIMSFPPNLRNMGTSVLKAVKPGVSSDKIGEILRQDYLDLEHAYPVSRLIFLDSLIRKLIKNKELPENAVKILMRDHVSFESAGFNLPFLSKISYGEMFSYMQHTLLRDTDQMSMAHALEVRVPFLDHRLVEYVLGVNDRLKYPHTPKKLLVESMGDLLPTEVVNRPKMGFTLPWELWMRNELKDFCEDKLKALANRPIFEGKELMQLWSRFLKGDKKLSWSRIWPLIVLEDWMEKNEIA